MRSPLASLVLIVLASIVAPMPALAQPTPPRPPAAGAPHPPARRAGPPVVRPAPGAPGRHVTPRPGPARPAPRGPARPAAPHAAPVPVPVPAAPPEPEKPAEPARGSNTGLPLPRFAALRSEEVNFRTGPGVRYPIDWVYKRRDLPVQIEREFEVWRLVADPDGTKGWVHQATLAPRRTAVVTGGEHVLRASADDNGGSVARLKPGVILRLRSCEASSAWCQAQVGDYRGWMKRADMWGTSANEAIQ